MQKINDWENVQASSDFASLPAGGYIVVIRKVEDKVNQNGKTYLEIKCDIAEGDFKDMAVDNEKALRKMDAYYGGKANGLFKRFTESVENSNRNFKWNWDESKLIGKVFGVVMYQEEYVKDGDIRIATKIDYTTTTTVDKIRKGDFKLIPMKKLDPSIIPATNDNGDVNYGNAEGLPF